MDELGPGGPPPTLLQQGSRAVAETVATKPSSFTIGAHANGREIAGGLTYDRTWVNGWGLTAYAKAWWNDASVMPEHKGGGAVGFEAKKSF